jgi:hypothetical protein
MATAAWTSLSRTEGRFANSSAPTKWGLRVVPGNLMLKVGFVEVLQVGLDVRRGQQNSAWFHQLVYRDLVPKRTKANTNFRFSKAPYRWAPGCDSYDVDIARMAGAHRLMRGAHEAAIRIACRAPRRIDIVRDHSPPLIRFIFGALGLKPVQPGYVDPHGAWSPIAEELPSSSVYEEGAISRVLVNRYERDPLVL